MFLRNVSLSLAFAVVGAMVCWKELLNQCLFSFIVLAEAVGKTTAFVLGHTSFLGLVSVCAYLKSPFSTLPLLSPGTILF